MQGYIQGTDRQQTTPLPECRDDWIHGSNPVRAVDVIIYAHDLRDLGFEGVVPEATGRRAYQGGTIGRQYGVNCAQGRADCCLRPPCTLADAVLRQARPGECVILGLNQKIQ